MATDGAVPIDFEGIFTKTPALEAASTPAPSELDGPDGLHLTPIGNSERFLRDHSENVRWVQGPTMNSAGTFYTWAGQRWQADNTKAVLLAKETVSDLQQLVAMALEQGLSSDTVQALVRFWKGCETECSIKSILNVSKWNVAIKQGEFDADPNLLGVKNGVVDLRTGELRPAVREDYITKQANVIFDAAATCPLWEKFLLETASNKHESEERNHELIAYVQQLCGLSLTGETIEHLLILIIGPAGTGKSTFCETIKYVWGDYCIGIDPNSLAASSRAEGGRARPDIARLPGVRLAFANETRKGLQLDAGLVKAMTGGDTVQARHLYEKEFDFKPTHKLWLRTNEEPQFDGGDTGMQRRVRKIPFVHKVEAQDSSLPEKLRAEAAGILNWAIRGLLGYRKHGLSEPAVVTEETAEYIKSLDTLAQFVEEKCNTAPGFRQSAGTLYKAYRSWIEARGQYALSQPNFKVGMRAKGFWWKKTNEGAFFHGICLQD